MEPITRTMAESLSLPLRAWPSQNSEWEDLPFLVAQINAQKGSFRKFSEQTLQEELERREAGAEESNNNESILKDAAVDAKTRKEELLTARNDILTYVVYIQLRL